MVYLSRIYTKSGDDGQTSLGDGARVPKDDLRVEAYGAVDELNAVLGLLLACEPDFPERTRVGEICNDLFDVGADLCVPVVPGEEAGSRLRVSQAHVRRLEADIDRINTHLAPLRSFVLPGGTPAAAWAHLARTVCRRAERRVVTLHRHTAINPTVVVYLNRLSDWLFVLARAVNRGGDILWQPGKSGGSE